MKRQVRTVISTQNFVQFPIFFPFLLQIQFLYLPHVRTTDSFHSISISISNFNSQFQSSIFHLRYPFPLFPIPFLNRFIPTLFPLRNESLITSPIGKKNYLFFLFFFSSLPVNRFRFSPPFNIIFSLVLFFFSLQL